MKILIITKNWLGDLFFQMPAIEAIAEAWPQAEIICLAPPRCVDLLKSMPCVKEVITYDEKNQNRSLWKRFSVIFKLRQYAFDKAFIFHRSKTRAFLAWAGGCRERTGFDTKGKYFLTTAIRMPQQKMHHADTFLFLLRQAGLKTEAQGKYCLNPSKEERIAAEDLLRAEGLKNKTFICFHLGANWEPKRWPIENFVQLAEMLFEQWGWKIVITGAAGDQGLANDFAHQVQDVPLVVLTGKTSPGVLAAVFQKAQCLVSGDSGPMHIAAAAGCRVIALFGPTDPALTGPRGCGENIVLNYVPQGFKVPYYGDKLPEDGWLKHIQPRTILDALKTKGWFSEVNASG